MASASSGLVYGGGGEEGGRKGEEERGRKGERERERKRREGWG